MKSTETTKQDTQGIVMPAVNAQQAVEAWTEYLKLKKAIVDRETDIQVIQGKEFLKKSYWRKVSTFFNLSVRKIDESHEVIGKTVVWHFTIEAVAPNGRTAVGTGSCDAFEKATLVNGKYMSWGKEATPNSLHNIRSTAETRATNRAISNLVGGGEVSADEVVVETETKPQVTQVKTEAQEAKRPQDTEHFCTIHNKPLKERQAQNGGHYWDHRFETVYGGGDWNICNGLPKKEKSFFKADEATHDSMPLEEALDFDEIDMDQAEREIEGARG